LKPVIYAHVWSGKDEGTRERCSDIWTEMLGVLEASGILAESAFHPLRTGAANELQTLQWLHKDACEMEPRTPVLYLHLKGASWLPGRDETACVDDWRRMMLYFCVERWRDALEELGLFKAVGCNVSTVHHPHFSGNVWWARAGALAALPRPQTTWDRMAAEFWIGGVGLENMGSLHQSGVDHYFVRYPRERYMEASLAPRG
jgi:hypothetical protein